MTAWAAFGVVLASAAGLDGAGEGPALIEVNLGDDWAPAIFSESAAEPQPYRATYVALENERLDAPGMPESARRDRAFELFGIPPSLSVIRRRLLDVDRHACHAAIDDEPLRAVRRTLAPWEEPPAAASAQAARRVVITTVQAHLGCDGLLPAGAASGLFDARTVEALALYQRRHMLPSPAVLDAETRQTLLTDSRELDFRALLRALRERVVDATGLIEDGSAAHAWAPVLGRFIDSVEYRHRLRPEPAAAGAPDLIDPATEAVARALGWTSPTDAIAALAAPLPPRLALALPPPPAYHRADMELRAEIDRGDVWRSYPLDAQGRPRPSPAKWRPMLTLYARAGDGEIALVRWPTTIGAWKKEKQDDESVALRYKPSPVGRFYWRDLVAAPAWFPPPTTPDDELLRRSPGGTRVADQDAVGPGYRSAYGLVALLHGRALGDGSAGMPAYADLDIRTHGSGSYRSILRGTSHGCHRLFNHLAVRLGGFLLAHRPATRLGLIREAYARTLQFNGQTFKLRVATRGYRFTLDPPVPVDVLPGRPVRSRAAPQQPPGGHIVNSAVTSFESDDTPTPLLADTR
ncbi:MAG TPA: hypothetical protein VNO55_11375 [Polyangia bacterium]|nr:hypothetical protein [Polyangia bacterium]